MKLMEKERLGAFIDAVIAIVMTILVLELEKPEELTIFGFWELRESFFAYALSFFWLGAMWVNLHYSHHLIDRVSQKTVWATMLMLFFASLFPYTTKLISSDFNNGLVQGIYGVVVLLITASVLWYYRTLEKANPDSHAAQNNQARSRWIRYDIALKLIGLLLSFTIFPPAMSLAVLITLCVLVIPNQLR